MGVIDKMEAEMGSDKWNDMMFTKHPTPYNGLAGKIEKFRSKKIIHFIQENKKRQNFTLLEIGCEAGNLLGLISRKFKKAELIGVDISDIALKKARTNLKTEIELIKLDITNQPLKLNKKIDFLICSETLEHILNVERAIENLAKSCTNETILIITVPNEKLKNLIKIILNKLKIFNLFFKGIESGFSEWHLQDFSKKEILNLLSSQFKIIKYKNILFLHHLIVLKNISNRVNLKR